MNKKLEEHTINLFLGNSTATNTFDLSLRRPMMGVQEIYVASVSQNSMTQPRLKLDLVFPSALRESANTSNLTDGGCFLLVGIDLVAPAAQVLTDYNHPVPWCTFHGQTTLNWSTMRIRVTDWDETAVVFDDLHLRLITHSTLSDPVLPISHASARDAGNQQRYGNLMPI